jgi:murein DD-endopeptidase MepM/ murein hydrolase activator NlpD
MFGRPKRRTRGRLHAGRSPLQGSLRLFLLLCLLVGVNVYVFFYRGGTSVKDVLRAAALPPQKTALGPSGISGPAGARKGGRGAKTPAAIPLGKAAPAPSTLPVDTERLLTAVIEPGDTLRGKLAKLGIARVQADEAVAALRGSVELQRVRPGQVVRVRLSGNDLRGLELDVSPILTFRVDRDEEGRWRADRSERQVQTRVVAVGGTVGSSLYEAVHSAGESTQLVAAIADLFAHDMNFYVDTHPGDTFRVLVEKQYKDGDFFRYGRVLGAEYGGKVGAFHCYYFVADALGAYYNEQGQNCAKQLLKTPLKFARLTSKFDRKRMHPILHVQKGHYGVDYGAPTGTPIWASASGKVAVVAKHPGSGNTIVLQHNGGLTTHYYHLSKFAKGIAPGQQVKQKQVIGYVGATGLATGPHLHFSVKQGGAYVDPLKMKIAREAPLPTKHRAAFERAITERATALAATPVTGAARAAAPVNPAPGEKATP